MAKRRKKKSKKSKRGKKGSFKSFAFAPKEGIKAALDRKALVKKITGELKELE
jgi:hypothetical protein